MLDGFQCLDTRRRQIGIRTHKIEPEFKHWRDIDDMIFFHRRNRSRWLAFPSAGRPGVARNAASSRPAIPMQRDAGDNKGDPGHLGPGPGPGAER